MREWGIRIAIGARPAALLRHVQARGARIAAAGLAVGLVSALLLSRYLRSLLFGVEATDALSYALACTLLLCVALLASYLPARTATRTDATRALRAE
jgi:putative ABC transport system permease protein